MEPRGWRSNFLFKQKIGITKADNGDVNEKGLFKQEEIRFKDNDTSYAFYLDLEDGTELKNDIVFIGAQRSCFKMEVKPSDETLFIPDHAESSILLLSPSFINDYEKFNNYCLQHWSGTTCFRNLKQNKKGKLQSGIISYQRHTSLCTFLTAGSVIFYKDNEQLKELTRILDNKNLQNIGYNKYSIK